MNLKINIMTSNQFSIDQFKLTIDALFLAQSSDQISAESSDELSTLICCIKDDFISNQSRVLTPDQVSDIYSW